MEYVQAIILGVVQGLTEFIPVSSSGHLVIAHEILNADFADSLTFDVALHVGTLLSLIVYFRLEIVQLIRGILGKNEYTRLSWLIVLATIPAVIIGLLFGDFIENNVRSPAVVAFSLAFVALLMLVAEKYAKKRQLHDIGKVDGKRALGIGFAQALALIPGMSRSGSTITAGLLFGVNRVAATRFSFLMAIPIIFGAIVQVLLDGGYSSLADNTGLFVVGIVSACISGLFAISFLLKFLSNNSLAVFAYYRLALAAVVVLVLV